jgi:hypothetical protein
MLHSNKAPHQHGLSLLAGCLALLVPTLSQAIDVFQVSPDITITMDAQAVTDQNVALDGIAISLASLGALPANADLSAFHVLANGDRLFVLDIATTLPGNVYAEPRDVVRYNGTTYALELDGSSAGIPAGTRIDALSMDQSGALLMSFDVTVNLGGLLAADEDLLRRSSGVFSMFFDGSVEGLSSDMDLDAVHYLPGSNQFLLSFDTSGQIGSLRFDDEDVLFYDPANASWSSAYRGAERYADFNAADLNALYIALYTSELFKDGFETLP